MLFGIGYGDGVMSCLAMRERAVPGGSRTGQLASNRKQLL